MTIGSDTHFGGMQPVWTNLCTADHAGDMKRARSAAAALVRRVVLINGLIFTLGTLILALSPATVSARNKLTEIPVLGIGLAVMLTAKRVAAAVESGSHAEFRAVDG
jgi:two-component system, NarL family, sensor histidine kinase UhpB